MEEKTVTSLFEEMRSDVKNYVINTLEIGKLQGYEKISKGSATISFLIVLLFFVFQFLGLLLFTLGFYLSEAVFDSFWKGFGVVSAGLLVVVIILISIKKFIQKGITNSVIKFLLKTEDDEVDFRK